IRRRCSHTAEPAGRWRALHRGSDSVQRARVGPQDLVDRGRADFAAFFQLAQGVDFARRVVMAVVGSDDDVVFPGVFENVAQIGMLGPSAASYRGKKYESPRWRSTSKPRMNTPQAPC